MKTFWEELIWGTASETLEVVLHCFLPVQFYPCPQFWQIYIKWFLHTALLVFATHFEFGKFIFVFFILFPSSYFFNANVTLISVTSILHTNVCCFWWLCYLQNFTHFSYYCLLPSRHKDVVTTLLGRRYQTSLWRCYIVAMEMLDDVAKTTSLQCLIKRRHNETLQRRRFCHCNYVATLERQIATPQRRCNIVLSYGKQIKITKLYYYQKSTLFWNYFTTNRVFQ